ncbi:MAG: tripartite tricarboxylate transporter substrate-binding protein, partial [Burkholderiales bacterium]
MKRALTACILIAASSVAAAAYPDRPIRFIVPFAPGGTNDIVARLVGVKLTEAWGQPVVIDNRGGAGGVIGADMAAKAVPDGYTLLMANVNFATNPGLVRNLPYDTVKDFAAVS